MKRCFSLIVIIFILLFIIQIIVEIFISERSMDYVRRNDINVYKIKEDLSVINGASYYDITISDKFNNFYSVAYSGEFNRQSEIIENISEYKEKGLTCILPLYKRNRTGELSCIYDGKQVSFSYLRQIGNKDVDKIIENATNDGYKNSNWSVENKPGSILSDYDKPIIYYDHNLPDNYTFLIWRYRGLFLLRHNGSIVKDYLDHDQYDNNFSALVGKYYVSPNTNDSTLNEFIFYNIKELGKGTISTRNMVPAGRYYLNGVYKNKLYFTDLNRNEQYTINPSGPSVTLVGDKELGFIDVVDGKTVRLSADEFLNKKVLFKKRAHVNEIVNKYGEGTEIYKQRNFYYFKTNDGGFYRTSEHELNVSELLFKLSDVKEWKIVNGDILIVAGTKLYFYNDSRGLLLIAEDPELKYNYKNICDFYKE